MGEWWCPVASRIKAPREVVQITRQDIIGEVEIGEGGPPLPVAILNRLADALSGGAGALSDHEVFEAEHEGFRLRVEITDNG